MKLNLIIAVFGILIIGIVTFQQLKARHTEEDVMQKVFQNQQIFGAMASSQQVIAQRLHARKNIPENGESFVKLNGYVIDAPISLTSSQTEKVRQLLESPSTYTFNGNEKACIPNYG